MANIEKILWDEYKKQVSKDSKNTINDDLEKQFFQYVAWVKETEQIYLRLQSTLSNIPIAIALRYWLNTLTSPVYQKKYYSQILTLIEKKIIPIKNEQNHAWTLKDLQDLGELGHKKVIEEIRCLKDCSLATKEELVQGYIAFSNHLNQNTLGLIPKATDPGQIYASRKIISYDNFITFTQSLSQRDALIAKLLYFGAPTIEEVLFLTYGQLNFNNYTIHYSKEAIEYPKHLMFDLLNFVGKKKKNDAIFLNYKGNQIVRTHLNQSFGRASKAIIPKITPRDLLKLKL